MIGIDTKANKTIYEFTNTRLVKLTAVNYDTSYVKTHGHTSDTKIIVDYKKKYKFFAWFNVSKQSNIIISCSNPLNIEF